MTNPAPPVDLSRYHFYIPTIGHRWRFIYRSIKQLRLAGASYTIVEGIKPAGRAMNVIASDFIRNQTADYLVILEDDVTVEVKLYWGWVNKCLNRRPDAGLVFLRPFRVAHGRKWHPRSCRRLHVPSGLAIFRRKALEDVGGFEPHFKCGYFHDWMLRAACMGWETHNCNCAPTNGTNADQRYVRGGIMETYLGDDATEEERITWKLGWGARKARIREWIYHKYRTFYGDGLKYQPHLKNYKWTPICVGRFAADWRDQDKTTTTYWRRLSKLEGLYKVKLLEKDKIPYTLLSDGSYSSPSEVADSVLSRTLRPDEEALRWVPRAKRRAETR